MMLPKNPIWPEQIEGKGHYYLTISGWKDNIVVSKNIGWRLPKKQAIDLADKLNDSFIAIVYKGRNGPAIYRNAKSREFAKRRGY